MGVDRIRQFAQPSRHLEAAPTGCRRLLPSSANAAFEFLLVQTRGGRWIFPKGGVEPGLTHAQSAALEAFEEAGVHGRMEEIPFARYFRRKADTAIAKKTGVRIPDRLSQSLPWVRTFAK